MPDDNNEPLGEIIEFNPNAPPLRHESDADRRKKKQAFCIHGAFVVGRESVTCGKCNENVDPLSAMKTICTDLPHWVDSIERKYANEALKGSDVMSICPHCRCAYFKTGIKKHMKSCGRWRKPKEPINA